MMEFSEKTYELLHQMKESLDQTNRLCKELSESMENDTSGVISFNHHTWVPQLHCLDYSKAEQVLASLNRLSEEGLITEWSDDDAIKYLFTLSGVPCTIVFLKS